MEWINGQNQIRRLTFDKCKPLTVPLRVFQFFIGFHRTDENLTHRLVDCFKYIPFHRQDESRDSMCYIDDINC